MDLITLALLGAGAYAVAKKKSATTATTPPETGATSNTPGLPVLTPVGPIPLPQLGVNYPAGFTYNGRMINQLPAPAGVDSNGYLPNGMLVTATDANNNPIFFAYGSWWYNQIFTAQ